MMAASLLPDARHYKIWNAYFVRWFQKRKVRVVKTQSTLAIAKVRLIKQCEAEEQRCTYGIEQL